MASVLIAMRRWYSLPSSPPHAPVTLTLTPTPHIHTHTHAPLAQFSRFPALPLAGKRRRYLAALVLPAPAPLPLPLPTCRQRCMACRTPDQSRLHGAAQKLAPPLPQSAMASAHHKAPLIQFPQLPTSHPCTADPQTHTHNHASARGATQPVALPPPPPLPTCRQRCMPTSHRRMVPSLAPDRMVLPSSDTTSERTVSVCPRSLATCSGCSSRSSGSGNSRP